MKKYSIPHLLLSSSFKFYAVILSIIIFCAIFILSLRNFESRHALSDVAPNISRFTRRDEERRGPFSTLVRAGLYIKNFPKFDVIRNSYIINASVWFQFDPAQISLSNIGRFVFMDGEVKNKSTPEIKIVRDRVLAKYDVVVELFSDHRFHYFPYDLHKLPIMLSNEYATINSMILTTDDAAFNKEEGLTLSNWQIQSMQTDFGYKQFIYDRVDRTARVQKPIALFTIDFSNIGTKTAFIIFVPMLFTLLLGLFSLLTPVILNASSFLGLTLAIAAITSHLAYRFVIQTIIPAVGYLTTTDAVYVLCLAVLFLCFALVIISSYVAATVALKKTSDEFKERAIKKINLFLSIAFIVLLVVTSFILYKLMVL